jgi:hypothetical protein
MKLDVACGWTDSHETTTQIHKLQTFYHQFLPDYQEMFIVFYILGVGGVCSIRNLINIPDNSIQCISNKHV